MKKIGIYLSVLLISAVVFLLGFNYETTKQPYTKYQVYLNDEFIGTISSKSKLEKYVNKQGNTIRENVREYSLKIDSINTFNKIASNNKLELYTDIDRAKYFLSNKKDLKLSDIDIEDLKFYINEKLYDLSSKEIKEMQEYVDKNKIYLSVNKVYTPNGIEIKKIYTYDNKTISIKEAYKRIIQKKSCTIAGYKFTIKGAIEGVEDINIYTTDRKVFNDAIDKLVTIFVDDKKYENYKKGTQNEIGTVGSIIEQIYVQQDITYKAVNISVDDKIYTDATELSAYLLYGNNFEEKEVEVQPGDSIESISFDNKISVQEFLIFNPKYTSRENLLVPGTHVIISKIDPKLQVVVESYDVVDIETGFNVVEQYDESLSQGSESIVQEGANGLERVSQNVKTINGEKNYVDIIDKKTIKSSTSKIISIGTKYIPRVGSTSSWGWPANSYDINSYFGYRLSVYGEGNFHSGVDISGRRGDGVYAANNGVIQTMTYTGTYGNHIIIDHNNGYYTLYAHLNGFAKGLSEGSTVSRGQTIGYIGSSGWATGPHLHFEVRTCEKYGCITNPLGFY